MSHLIELKDKDNDTSAVIEDIYVTELDNKDNECVGVYSIDKPEIAIEALIDTGSPVNIVCYSVYLKYFSSKDLYKCKSSIKLKGINDSMITVLGKIDSQIMIEENNKTCFDIALWVVDDKTMRYNLLLGREFFDESGIKLIYEDSKYCLENKKSIKDNVVHKIFAIDTAEEQNKYDVIEDIDNMSWSNRKDLLQIFREVEELEIEPVKDDYCEFT